MEIREAAAGLWSRRRAVAVILAVFLGGGLLVTWTTPVEYEARATLLPEEGKESRGGRISSMAEELSGLLNLSLPEQRESPTEIPASLYPEIIRSVPYQLEVMSTPLRFSSLDTTLTAHAYFTEWYPASSMGPLRKSLVKMRRGLAGLFTGEGGRAGNSRPPLAGPLGDSLGGDTVLALTPSRRRTMAMLRSRISIREEPPVILVRAWLPDPQASAELGRAATATLIEYMKAYKTEKAVNEREYTREQLNEARRQYLSLQEEMASYRDRNVIRTSAGALLELEMLENRFQMAFGNYQNLYRDLERAKIRVQEQTPVFSTLKPLEIPGSPARPDLRMNLMVALFLGGMASVVYALFRSRWEALLRYASHRTRPPGTHPPSPQ